MIKSEFVSPESAEVKGGLLPEKSYLCRLFYLTKPKSFST